MPNRNQTFGQLLKAGISSIAYCEGKTAPVLEDELGQQIGVAAHTIQRYKAGHLPPEPRTVQLLAEACVRRGHLNRDWLQAFLQAAHYEPLDDLLDKLYPSGLARPRPVRVYHNLPAPNYTHFVMRQPAYDDVLDGLRQRSAVVLIASLGGMGKTSLAREVAQRCVGEAGTAPPFDAAVWVSDQDQPGTTHLSSVLDAIARTLDYPGFTQFAFDEKRYEVEQLLRRLRVLLVVDNFETITDGALLEWLLRLPEPSKAIVTTREERREFRRNCWPVELPGMTEAEAQTFIAERAWALKMRKLADDAAQLAPLITATGGNPKAIELALGLVKYGHQPLPQVIADLSAARGEVFDDLFTRAWALLDEAARRVLLSLPLFPASADGAALRAAADVPALAFDRAAGRLADLALLDVQRADLAQPPHYALHPLVRAFAAARLAEQPYFEQGARERWAGWYLGLAAQVGFCWDDLARLALLDPEQASLHAVADWLFAQRRYAELIRFAEGIRYYYNVRGLWDERLSVNLMRADAARALGDRAHEVLALAYHAEIRSKQGNLSEAAEMLARLQEVAASAELPDDVAFEVAHARALYARACGDLRVAEQTWQALLTLSARLGGQKSVINRCWLATCLHQQGQIAEAQQLYHESREAARAIGDLRSVSGNTLRLAAIDLEQENVAGVEAALAECRALAEQHQDRRRLAEVQRLSARLYALRGNRLAARAALEAAIDLFERMGMRREWERAQEESVRLTA